MDNILECKDIFLDTENIFQPGHSVGEKKTFFLSKIH